MEKETVSSTRRLVILSLFCGFSLAIYVLESLLPPLSPIPGIKLGLANVITLVLLMHRKPSEALFVLLGRLILSCIFTGSALYFFYSLAGGLVAYAIMVLCHHILGNRYIILTGICGALAHNGAQFTMAIALTRVTALLAYLPVLILAGILCGLFTGLCAHFTYKPLHRLMIKNPF